MKFLDIFKLSMRMFKARTSRTILTILGMSIGIAAILFLLSFGYGLQRVILDKITRSQSLLVLDVFPEEKVESFLNQEAIEKINKIKGIEGVNPAIEFNAQGNINDRSAQIFLLATNPAYLDFAGKKLIKGEFFSTKNTAEAVVTESVLRIFGIENPDEIIGKEISFFSISLADNNLEKRDKKTDFIKADKKYKIKGIVAGEETVVYISLDTLENKETFNFSQAKVKVKQQKDISEIRENITGQGFSVSAISDVADEANKVFRVIQIILMLFGIVALVVSSIGMFNTMTIALLERTSEIGIMKSIGASDESISAMFIMESAIMGFLGGLSGLLIGFFEGMIFNGLVNLVAVQMGGENVDLFYTPLFFVLAVIVFATIVGILTGFVPARRASKIDPLDALRYK